MPTGLEIFVAVGGVIAILNASRQAIIALYDCANGWEHVAGEIDEVNGILESIILRLQTWKRRWMADREFTDETGKSFWGDDGWGLLKRQIDDIDKLILELTENLENVRQVTADVTSFENPWQQLSSGPGGSGGGDVGNPGHIPNLSNGRRHGSKDYQKLAPRFAREPSSITKMSWILRKKALLEAATESLKKKFARFEDDAEEFFNATHPATIICR